MELEINAIYISSNKNGTESFRIVAVFDSIVFCFDLTKTHNMPYVKVREDLERLINEGFYIPGTEPLWVGRSEEELSDKDKEIRDKKYAAVRELWEDKDVALDCLKRARKIRELAKRFGVHPVEIRRDFSRFLQRGMMPNALLPDNYLKGGFGKFKGVSDKKRGRPVSSNIATRKEGINITPDIRKAIQDNVYREYMPNKHPSYRKSYEALLKSSFVNQHYINGNLVSQLISEENRPTYHQYYYYARRIVMAEPRKALVKRYGKTKFNLRHREQTGDPAVGRHGPGYRYEIDATHSCIYAVSPYDRKVCVGEVIIYHIVDEFSTLVPGVYVGVEEPSWSGAMLAIDNILEDKVDFCRRFGIEITPDEWPNTPLPEVLLADRGELKGKCPEGLTNMLSVEIENTPPYRADLKPHVERFHERIKGRLRSLPGAKPQGGTERGDDDYRKDATLTVYEITQIVISEIICHNTDVLENYNTSLHGIRGTSFTPTPVKIWNWGKVNTHCGIHVNNRDALRLALMYGGTASITKQGIMFKSNLFYSCQKALDEDWFISPKESRIDIKYDPRSVTRIFYYDKSNCRYKACDLLPRSYAYKDMSFAEYEAIEKAKKQAKGIGRNNSLQRRIDTDLFSKSIVAQATKLKGHGDTDVSNIKDNRKIEKTLRRRAEALTPLIGQNLPSSVPVKPLCNLEKEALDLMNRKEDKQNDL